jgi:hypothetical protein
MRVKIMKFLSILLDYIDLLVLFLIILLFISGIIFDMQGGELLNAGFLPHIPWVSIV